MKKVLATLLVGVFVVAMAGCSGGAKDDAAPGTDEGTSAAPAPAPGASPEAAAPPEAPAAAPGETAAVEPAAEGSGSLVGTTWQIGDFTVEFKDDSQVLVKGGQIATLMPDGAMGEYKVEDGKFSVSILGMTKSGTWDGQKLIIDDAEAIPQ